MAFISRVHHGKFEVMLSMGEASTGVLVDDGNILEYTTPAYLTTIHVSLDGPAEIHIGTCSG